MFEISIEAEIKTENGKIGDLKAALSRNEFFFLVEKLVAINRHSNEAIINIKDINGNYGPNFTIPGGDE